MHSTICAARRVLQLITQQQTVEIVRKLAAKCDMVAVNKQEDYMERLGLGYENLKAVNRSLFTEC